jgi:hypothetical protein
MIPTISTTEYVVDSQIPKLIAHNGGWVIKPLSHSKSLVTLFIEAEYEEDKTIPAFMLKTRMKSLG